MKEEFGKKFCYYPTRLHRTNDIPTFRPEVTVYEVWQWIKKKLTAEQEKSASFEQQMNDVMNAYKIDVADARRKAFDEGFTDEDMQHLAIRIDPAFYDIEIDGADASKEDFLRRLKIIINDLLKEKK